MTPWAVAHQAPLSMGFPRQGYWSGLPFPPPGDLPDPGLLPCLQPYKQVFFFTVTVNGHLSEPFSQCLLGALQEMTPLQSEGHPAEPR